jgi:uncharacterized damage-inducible protein DinB
MYRRVDDFLQDWAAESQSTRSVLRTLTDRSLAQRVAPGGRTAGRLAWHLVLTLGEMPRHSGLGIQGLPDEAPLPGSAAEILARYEEAAVSLSGAVKAHWTDALLPEEIPMYGEQWPRGRVLSVLIRHEAHHRGQLTVLMRQAGLTVPGVYGPAREEWAAMGMTPQE